MSFYRHQTFLLVFLLVFRFRFSVVRDNEHVLDFLFPFSFTTQWAEIVDWWEMVLLASYMSPFLLLFNTYEQVVNQQCCINELCSAFVGRSSWLRFFCTTVCERGKNYLRLFIIFQEQLNNLMTTLKSTQPHFVRCIIPNELKQPGMRSRRLWRHFLNFFIFRCYWLPSCHAPADM